MTTVKRVIEILNTLTKLEEEQRAAGHPLSLQPNRQALSLREAIEMIENLPVGVSVADILSRTNK